MPEKKYNPEEEIEKLCEKHKIYLEVGNDKRKGYDSFSKLKKIKKLNVLHSELLKFIDSGKGQDILVVNEFPIEVRKEGYETLSVDDVNNELTKKVYLELIGRKPRDATELIVKDILKKNYIYTTRDDENSEIWIYFEGVYIPQGKTFIREFCRKILGKAFTGHLANEVINKIEADTYIDQNKFFSNNIIEEVAVQNGILNIFKSGMGINHLCNC